MADDELRRWARTADFGGRVDWAQVDSRVRDAPVPTREELAELFPPSSRRWVLPLLLVLPQLLFSGGISLIALGFVVAHVYADAAHSELAETAAHFSFLCAIIVTFIPVLMWLSTKRRGAFQMILTAGTAVVSAVSFVLLSTETQDGTWSSMRTMAAVAVVCGLATTVFLRVFGLPGVPLTWGERLHAPDLEEQWLRGQRALVLAKRQLIST